MCYCSTMITFGQHKFPNLATGEQCAWEPTVRFVCLDRRVMIAARTRVEGKWAAYCKNVPGMKHEVEVEVVLEHGTKVSEAVARVLFPDFEEVPYAK